MVRRLYLTTTAGLESRFKNVHFIPNHYPYRHQAQSPSPCVTQVRHGTACKVSPSSSGGEKGKIEGKIGNLLCIRQIEEYAKINYGCTAKWEIFAIIHRHPSPKLLTIL